MIFKKIIRTDYIAPTLILEEHIVGSYWYGTETENSDKDFLCICEAPVSYDEQGNEEALMVRNPDNNTDMMYLSKDMFERELVKGGSTILIEVLFSPYCYLYCERVRLISYRMVNAYLGMARRDAEAERWEHYDRCVQSALLLLNGRANLKVKPYHVMTETLNMHLPNIKEYAKKNLPLEVPI